MAADNIDQKLQELRYELTAAQAKLTDIINALRAAGLTDIPVMAEGRRITGWRFVHGSHGGTYKPDPKGTDPLPPYYTGVPKETA